MTSKKQAGADNYSLWNAPRYTAGAFAKLSPYAQLEYFCLLAHLAPSSHNTQPWRFKIDVKKYGIEVLVDRTAILPESDPTGRQALISMGCCIGNITEGARCYSLVPRVSYTAVKSVDVLPLANAKAKNRYTRLATITFVPGKVATPGAVLKALFSRKVVRAEFDTVKKVSHTLLQKAVRAGAGEGIRTLFLDKAPDRLKVSELQQQADGFVANSPKFAKELGAWILPNDTTSYVGMPGSNMGLTQEGSARLHLGLLGKIKLKPEDMLKFSLGTKFLIERSAVLGFLFGKTDTPINWLKTGMLATKQFLLFEMNNVSVSIHAGLTEVGLVHDIFTNTFSQAGKLLMVYRIGYVKRKEDLLRPHSPRLPMEQIIIH